jgi:hypothetical protein
MSKCSDWLSICVQACFDVHHFGAYEHGTAKKYIKKYDPRRSFCLVLEAQEVYNFQ